MDGGTGEADAKAGGRLSVRPSILPEVLTEHLLCSRRSSSNLGTISGQNGRKPLRIRMLLRSSEKRQRNEVAEAVAEQGGEQRWSDSFE